MQFKRLISHLFCFRCFSKFLCWFLAFTKGGKSASPKIFIFYHPYESINFWPAGFLAFKEKSGPLLPPYIYGYKEPLFLVNGLINMWDNVRSKDFDFDLIKNIKLTWVSVVFSTLLLSTTWVSVVLSTLLLSTTCVNVVLSTLLLSTTCVSVVLSTLLLSTTCVSVVLSTLLLSTTYVSVVLSTLVLPTTCVSVVLSTLVLSTTVVSSTLEFVVTSSGFLSFSNVKKFSFAESEIL